MPATVHHACGAVFFQPQPEGGGIGGHVQSRLLLLHVAGAGRELLRITPDPRSTPPLAPGQRRTLNRTRDRRRNPAGQG